VFKYLSVIACRMGINLLPLQRLWRFCCSHVRMKYVGTDQREILIQYQLLAGVKKL
jgi:hypothetical protein